MHNPSCKGLLGSDNNACVGQVESPTTKSRLSSIFRRCLGSNSRRRNSLEASIIGENGNTARSLFGGLLPTVVFDNRAGSSYSDFGWSGSLSSSEGLRVARVKPVFSATAYAGVLYGSPSFYEFYHNHVNDPLSENITTNLNLLNVSVVDRWGWSERVPVHVHFEAEIVKGEYTDYDTFLGPEATEYLRLYMDQRRRGSHDRRKPAEDLPTRLPSCATSIATNRVQ